MLFESLINFFSSHKLILIAAVVISIIIIVSFIKKLLKVALVLTAAAVLYAAYCIYTGQRVTLPKKEALKHTIEKAAPVRKDHMRPLRESR